MGTVATYWKLRGTDLFGEDAPLFYQPEKILFREYPIGDMLEVFKELEVGSYFLPGIADVVSPLGIPGVMEIVECRIAPCMASLKKRHFIVLEKRNHSSSGPQSATVELADG